MEATSLVVIQKNLHGIYRILILCLLVSIPVDSYQLYGEQLFHFSTGNVSQQCQHDLDKTLFASNVSRDAIYALDAFGKPGSGVLVGDLVWLGTYQECQDLQRYHYCLVDLTINASVIPLKTDLPNIVPARWGTCFPTKCTEEDILNGLKELDEIVGEEPLDVTLQKVQCSDANNKWSDGVFVLTVVLCCIFGALMFIGYVADVFLGQCRNDLPLSNPSNSYSNVASQSTEESPLIKKEAVESESLLHRFILCFALNRNLRKLLDTKQNERSILCLNGIRVISMTWVILGHVFVVILQTQSIDNKIIFTKILKQFGFQAVLNAPYSVDTFFLLSGLLVTLGCMNRLEKTNGKLPWLWFYFHRFWRLTPTLSFIILITMTQQYLGDGPVWFPLMANMATKCQKYWWTTLLYINNFYPLRFDQQCVGVSWYLSNDMQFFVVSPIFILLLYKFHKLGLVSLIIGCVISFSVTIGLIVANDFDVTGAAALGTQPNGGNIGNSDFATTVYQKPYCRISVYFVGMAMGYLMHKHRRIRIPKILVVLGWLLATIVAMLVIYGLYPAIHEDRSLTPAANALYGALSRCAWAISVSWVIFACYFGYGGPVDTLLSWKGWVPLSRLTYTTYLMHQPVIYQYYMAHEVPWHSDLIDYCYYFVAIVGLAYSVAMVISLAIEYPFANMEKLFLPNSLQSNKRNPQKDYEKSKANGDV